MYVLAIELLSQNAKLYGVKISESWGLQFAVCSSYFGVLENVKLNATMSCEAL